ncbi:Folylpolyglutamate synthetase [Elasticomyces elasticus]|uniref:Heterokaryon incompatibility domain-containing protein n=1 Tax=Exophiala sideris TaxID=1016849 RepID=A0ABR0J059_9EURO|nr:Folylpolyglutamate synthetase [Elasticomyces elasticus]KAK5023613.1 hypothetical protein LTS07_009121 [Exophiala sideris]KAK5029613.1 Folylpolyglutamate synthetase [Exophiala sideris]KAK5053402.1 hypothetical protein LTR69_009360 [Exophiala sideris]KAK5179160.1 hypothetical protein LTR44_008314 [Eurotiomycetes sp. CCFEE 6388]
MSSSLWQQLSSERSTRVLVLHPLDRNHPEDIYTSLEEVNIDQQPHYDAISWTWGPEVKQQQIYVDGQEVLIRGHLRQFLLKVRGSEYGRRLWVDALCINQQDMVEKSHQVAMMGEIFKGATNVLAWVGSEADGSKEALRWLREAAWKVRADRIGVGVGPRQKETARVLMALLKRSWFGRKRVEVHCGNEVVKWEDLAIAIRWWCYGPGEITAEASHLKAVAQRLALLDTQRHFHRNQNSPWTKKDSFHHNRDISEIVHDFKSFQCTDPRDRIFALISLEVDIPSTVKLKPDYTLTREQTFVSVFRQKQPHLVFDCFKSRYLGSLAKFAWQMAETLGLQGHEHVADILRQGIQEGDKEDVWRGTARAIQDGNVFGHVKTFLPLSARRRAKTTTPHHTLDTTYVEVGTEVGILQRIYL